MDERRISRIPALLATLVAIALTAGACGGGTDSGEAAGAEGDGSTSVDGSDSDAGDGEEGEDDGDPFEYESPLGDFLGISAIDFGSEDSAAEEAERQRQIQEQIADCMTAQGFEYQPVDHGGGMFSPFTSEEDLPEEERWGTEAWTRKYGFGVSTMRYSQEQVGPDLVGWFDPMAEAGEEFVDPNQAYLDSLGDDERAAYERALWGEYPTPPWEMEGREPTDEELDSFDWEPTVTGCNDQAFDAVYGFGETDEIFQEFETEFGSLLEEMEERLEAHPDMAAHRESVTTCLADRGVDYQVDGEPWEYWEQRLEEAGLGWVDPFEGIDPETMSEEEIQAAIERAESGLLPAEDLAALAEVQQEEITTAVAVLECGGDWETEFEVSNDIRIQLEEEFLADNADRLAAFEGAFEGIGG